MIMEEVKGRMYKAGNKHRVSMAKKVWPRGVVVKYFGLESLISS